MIRGVDGRRIVFLTFLSPPLFPLLRVIVEYAYNIHQVFRREAKRSRFALPCKCAIIYLNVSQSTIPWIHARARVFSCRVFVYSRRRYLNSLMENHNGKSETPARYCPPRVFFSTSRLASLCVMSDNIIFYVCD